MDVNLTDVVAEVEAAFLAYEAALVADDVTAMDAWFWRSPLTVRFGVADRQYGFDEVAAWRRSAGGLPPGREIGPTVVATFGRDAATVTTEFRYPGRDTIGRQSQTWIRFPDGWRVVGAHVSVVAAHH